MIVTLEIPGRRLFHAADARVPVTAIIRETVADVAVRGANLGISAVMRRYR